MFGRSEPGRDERPRWLIRYRALSDKDFEPQQLGWLASTLRDGIVYASQVRGFNDPWEAKPRFSVRPDPARPEEALASFLVRLNPDSETSPWERHLVDDYRRQIVAHGTDVVLDELQRQFSNLICGTWALSLSEDSTQPLMWSHYAVGHTGYALCFDTQALPFSAAIPVQYQDEYPTIDVSSATKPLVALQAALCCKAKYWKYEMEWRVIIPKRSPPFDFIEPTESSGHQAGAFLRIPQSSLKAILLGAAMKPDSIRRITRLVRTHAPSVRIVQCKIHKARFEVLHEALD